MEGFVANTRGGVEECLILPRIIGNKMTLVCRKVFFLQSPVNPVKKRKTEHKLINNEVFKLSDKSMFSSLPTTNCQYTCENDCCLSTLEFSHKGKRTPILIAIHKHTGKFWKSNNIFAVLTIIWFYLEYLKLFGFNKY